MLKLRTDLVFFRTVAALLADYDKEEWMAWVQVNWFITNELGVVYIAYARGTT